MRIQFVVLAAAVFALVVVVALLALPSRGPAPTYTLRAALPSFGVEVLDPSADFQAGHRYYGHLFDYLISAGPRGEQGPPRNALESWTASADASTYLLRLRPAMRWHDGSEVTAGDLRFSLEHYDRAAAACAACGKLGDQILGMDAVERHTLEVRLARPDPTFIGRLGPDHEDVPLVPGDGPVPAGTVLGSGPWKFLARSPGESISFESNDSYWDNTRVPAFDRLVLLHVPDPATRVAMLRAGTLDLAPIEPWAVEALKAAGFTVHGPKNVVETALRFFMSYDSAYLTSRKEFRQALIVGTDLAGAVVRLYPPEAATPASGSTMFTPEADGYEAGLPAYGYDPEQARDLLKKVGYAGERVSLLSIPVYDMPEIPSLNSFIADDWRRIGINVSVVPATYVDVKARFLARPQSFSDLGSAPAFHGGHVNRPGGIVNAIHRYLTGAAESLMSFPDPAAGDRTFEEIARMPEGPARTARLKALNRQLHAEFWSAPVMWRHEAWALVPAISEWRPSDGMSTHLNFETVRRRGG